MKPSPYRHRYSRIANRVIEDKRLRWSARGLLVYLLSRPTDWKVITAHLVKQGELGRDGILSLLKELREHRYLDYVRRRDKHGRIAGGDYSLRRDPVGETSQEPQSAAPNPDDPDAATPDALPITDTYLRPTTTTTTTVGRGSSSLDSTDLEYPAAIVPAERRAAEKLIEALDAEHRQPVLDEWAGIIAADAIRSSVIACLRALIQRAQEGTFTLERGLRIQHQREERHKLDNAIERARAAAPDLPPADQETEIVRRLRRIEARSRRERE